MQICSEASEQHVKESEISLTPLHFRSRLLIQKVNRNCCIVHLSKKKSYTIPDGIPSV